MASAFYVWPAHLSVCLGVVEPPPFLTVSPGPLTAVRPRVSETQDRFLFISYTAYKPYRC